MSLLILFVFIPLINLHTGVHHLIKSTNGEPHQCTINTGQKIIKLIFASYWAPESCFWCDHHKSHHWCATDNQCHYQHCQRYQDGEHGSLQGMQCLSTNVEPFDIQSMHPSNARFCQQQDDSIVEGIISYWDLGWLASICIDGCIFSITKSNPIDFKIDAIVCSNGRKELIYSNLCWTL